ncbi:MAG: hypothetical protein ACFFFB_27045 [Candidatus Heimdallarchaeota archaeon]
MSDREIAYDVRLEEQLEEIRLKIWINEELQIQPKKYHSQIKENYMTFLDQN